MDDDVAGKLFWLTFPVAIGLLMVESQLEYWLVEVLAYGVILAFAFLEVRMVAKTISPGSLSLLVLRWYMAAWVVIVSVLVLSLIDRLGGVWYLVALLAWAALYLGVSHTTLFNWRRIKRRSASRGE